MLVIDAQNDFCHPEGLKALQGRDVSSIPAALERLEILLASARAADIPVFLVRTTHSEETDTPEWIERHGMPDGDAPCAEGSWGAEWILEAHESDLIVTKHRYSAFVRTDLAERLRAEARSSLHFAGFATNVCVETSLRDAVCLDFLTTLVEDCCAAYSPEAHSRAIAAVSAGFGQVVQSDALMTAWNGRELEETN